MLMLIKALKTVARTRIHPKASPYSILDFLNSTGSIFNTFCKYEKMNDGEIILCSDDVSLSSIESITFVLNGMGHRYDAKDLFFR